MTDFDISAASFAYPEVPTELRSRLATALIGGEPTDAFVLNTCLRLEVAVAGDPGDLDRALKTLFGEVPQYDGMEVRRGVAAIHHLYRIAAGLESPVLGEPEILTQYRGALNDQKGRMEGMFQKVLEQAIPVARSARELLPFSPHESMAAVAAQVVGASDRAAVFGSGVMATSVAEALAMLPSPPEITMVARHPDRVTVEGVAVLPLDAAADVIATFPAVISATSAKTRLLDTDELVALLDTRTSRLTLVDMAMPPDFSPPEGAPVDYVDIDDLAARAARRARSDAADDYVGQAATAVHQRVLGHQDVGPVIRHMMERADELVDQTVARFAGRLADTADEAVLRQAVHTVARAMLADPVAYVKETDPDSIAAVAEAFGLDD